MSGFFSNFFGGTPAAAPAAQSAAPAQTNPGDQPANGGNPPAAVTNAVATQTATAANPQNPLDFLMALGQNTQNAKPDSPPSLSIPQDTLANISKSIDYSKHIAPESLQKLQAGDMTGLAEILNSTLQAQYQTIMHHNSTLTDKFVNDRLAHDRKSLQQTVRADIVDSSLKISDLHPVAQGMFRQIAKQLAGEYPEANPSEIEEQTWVALEQLGNQFNRTGKKEQAATKASEVDWDKFGEF